MPARATAMVATSERRSLLVYIGVYVPCRAAPTPSKAAPDFAKGFRAGATRFFKRDSHGLLRTKVPEGRVLMGEPSSLGEVELGQK